MNPLAERVLRHIAEDHSRATRERDALRSVVKMHGGEHHCVQNTEPHGADPCDTLRALALFYGD